MPSYRLYKFDPGNDQRGPGEWLDAADDGDAIRLARELASDSKCELWLQRRLVGILAREA